MHNYPKLERGVSIEDVTVFVMNMMGLRHQKWKCALFILASYSVNFKRLLLALNCDKLRFMSRIEYIS